MNKKMLFIINAQAGRGTIRNKLIDIIDLFTQNGYSIQIYSTQKQPGAKEIVQKQGESFDIVVCSGGDGTLSEIISGVMECDCDKRPIIGYIPAGTVNDFSYNLSINRDLLQSANTIVKEVFSSYDVALLNQKYFIYCAAFGAFTNTSYATPQITKNILGKFAYFLEGTMQLDSLKPYHLTIQNDKELIEDDFLMGLITNSKSIAGFKGFIQNNIQLDDGLFEACFIKMPKNPLDLSMIIMSLMKKEFHSNFFYNFTTSNLLITSLESFPWTLDGEFGGEYFEVEIKVIKQAVSIIGNKKTLPN